jgi:hypothetical protein
LVMRNSPKANAALCLNLALFELPNVICFRW